MTNLCYINFDVIIISYKERQAASCWVSHTFAKVFFLISRLGPRVIAWKDELFSIVGGRRIDIVVEARWENESWIFDIVSYGVLVCGGGRVSTLDAGRGKVVVVYLAEGPAKAVMTSKAINSRSDDFWWGRPFNALGYNKAGDSWLLLLLWQMLLLLLLRWLKVMVRMLLWWMVVFLMWLWENKLLLLLFWVTVVVINVLLFLHVVHLLVVLVRFLPNKIRDASLGRGSPWLGLTLISCSSLLGGCYVGSVLGSHGRVNKDRVGRILLTRNHWKTKLKHTGLIDEGIQVHQCRQLFWSFFWSSLIASDYCHLPGPGSKP